MGGSCRDRNYVSRETLGRIETYSAELLRWNPRINLVARGDESRVWARHVEDSLQLLALMPDGLAEDGSAQAVDLGSGGGFPGMVLAIASGVGFMLVEADARKAAFLREAARLATAPVRVLAQRIEVVAPQGAMLVTARALAPLPRLLPLVARHLAPGGTALLMKGAGHDRELTEAATHWHMKVMRHPSRTDPDGTILRVTELRPARPGHG
jgi:16S rRNA (guanine527-N7)-methyltransferase